MPRARPVPSRPGWARCMFDGLPHGVPMGYLRTHPTVGSGLAVVTEGEALTEANAKLVVKKSGVRLGGPGSQTIKANASVFIVLNFGLSIPAQTTRTRLRTLRPWLGMPVMPPRMERRGRHRVLWVQDCDAEYCRNLYHQSDREPRSRSQRVGWRIVVFNY